MESPYHIFVLIQIYPCFATDTAVYLGKKGGWDLDKINASQIGSGTKTGKITYYTTAKSHDEAFAIQFFGDKSFV